MVDAEGAMNRHQMPTARFELIYGVNSDTDTRRELDRWENEGGRIRLRSSRDAGHWPLNLAENAGEQARVRGRLWLPG